MRAAADDVSQVALAVVEPAQGARGSGAGLGARDAEVLDDEAPLEIGMWFWVLDTEDNTQDLGCVTHLGSNYAQVTFVGDSTQRIHFDVFDVRCERILDPTPIIDREIAANQKRTLALMEKVKEIAANLHLGPSPALADGASGEVTALAVLTSSRKDEPVHAYKKALVKAKNETLPKLFEKIKKSNEEMARWMGAKLIPFEAQAARLESTIAKVKDRIFSVELYAGLTETVVEIQKGEPAPLTERVRLFQRRAYMDEECIAQYRAGGVILDTIEDFDAWLCAPENLERLLPFPRCALTFRIRRHVKDREIASLHDFLRIRFGRVEETDKLTYLYMRNGSQVFRMSTSIEFGKKLFPDLAAAKIDRGNLWYNPNSWRGDDDGLLTEDDYRVRLAELRAAEGRNKGRKRTDRSYEHIDSDLSDIVRYVPFTRETVYYDDIAAKIESKVKTHNRIALVLQGLLDRSPVFHPHPPWVLGSAAGFTEALELVYDDDRALVTGDKPDFEAYRARLNASLRAWSVTVGQDVAWEEAEAKKLSESDRRRRGTSDFERKRYSPPGNPGPGVAARAVEFTRNKIATFRWTKERQDWRSRDRSPLPSSFRCHAKLLLNADAYTPGDFKVFYADPRTRAEYLQWAPLLLAAEEYHAGNLKPGVEFEHPEVAARAAAEKREMREAVTKAGWKQDGQYKWDCDWVSPDGELRANLHAAYSEVRDAAKPEGERKRKPRGVGVVEEVEEVEEYEVAGIRGDGDDEDDNESESDDDDSNE